MGSACPEDSPMIASRTRMNYVTCNGGHYAIECCPAREELSRQAAGRRSSAFADLGARYAPARFCGRMPPPVSELARRSCRAGNRRLDRKRLRYRGVDVIRGDLAVVALQGDFGKPRPALIIQSDLFAEHPTVTVLPITSDLREAPLLRLTVQPSPENGLRSPSQIMVDKAHTVLRDKVGQRIGRLDGATMVAVNRALALFLGFA